MSRANISVQTCWARQPASQKLHINLRTDSHTLPLKRIKLKSHSHNQNIKKAEELIHTVHSCISCSLVASRMTKMFSLRADSCCCCLSFSSDSFRPVTSLAKPMKRGRKANASKEIPIAQLTVAGKDAGNRNHALLHLYLCSSKCTYSITLHILPPGPGCTLHAVSTYEKQNMCQQRSGFSTTALISSGRVVTYLVHNSSLVRVFMSDSLRRTCVWRKPRTG